MNPNQKKKFTDQFRNPNGSYHIPTWLIVVMFIIGGWPIAICLLVAKIFEDKEGSAEAASAEASDGFPAEGTQNGTAEGARAARASAPFGALAAIKPLVLPGVGKKTLVYVIKTSVL